MNNNEDPQSTVENHINNSNKIGSVDNNKTQEDVEKNGFPLNEESEKDSN